MLRDLLDMYFGKQGGPDENDMVIVRILKPLRIAVPVNNPISPGKPVLEFYKEDVVTLPVKYAKPIIKAGYGEEIPTNPYGIRKVEANTHDMGKSGAEGMAYVEG